MHWLKSLQRVLGLLPRRQRAGSPRKTRFRLELEGLEERSLLSVTATLTAGNLLIQGSVNNDSIRISIERVIVGYTHGSSGNLVPIREDMVRLDSSTLLPGATFHTPDPVRYFLARDVNHLEVYAGAGNDTVRNNTGLESLLDGGSGNDLLYGGSGIDHMYGGTGANELHGGAGIDWLFGGNGVDRLYGDAGNDFLDGGSVRDGSSGSDVVDGGPDDDVAQDQARTGFANVERITQDVARLVVELEVEEVRLKFGWA